MMKAKKSKAQIVLIDGKSLSLERAEAIAKGATLRLAPSVQQHITASQNLVKQLARGKSPIYGVNTGIGLFGRKRLTHSQLLKLQDNILMSHASGYGDLLSIPETRLAMSLKLNVLAQGYSGVSYKLCTALLKLIEADIYPAVPMYGSVGAGGDLVPSAHLALPLTGKGVVRYRNKAILAIEALQKAKLKPIRLQEKEALSLINGTQVMLAVGSLALAKARQLCIKADKITALSYEGLNVSPEPLHPFIHELRAQRGQIDSARTILEELEGSSLLTAKQHPHVQEPYSLRCAPQIHGPSRDALNYAIDIIEKEMNATTDDPLVFCELNRILTGGNFHGQPIAMAFDIASIAVTELALVSERRLEVLLNPNLSKLPTFLNLDNAVNSGYMATQYLSASLVGEAKILASPSCMNSIPVNACIEDSLSMGMTAALKLKHLVEYASVVLAIELLVAAQAVDIQHIKRLGKGTAQTQGAVREIIPKLTNDRIVADDISKAITVFELI